jgi:putative transposase
MSHTHFLYHIIFATKDRQPIIQNEWKKDLHAYLGGIVKNFEGVPIEINGIADHVHLLVRLQPKISFSNFMRELKASSSKWIRQNYFPKFGWQSRFGAFTVSESQVEKVRKYIRNQEVHHRQKNFTDEYIEILKAHKIDFDENYLWN